MSEDDWMARVASIRRWSRGGARAPHKPLLLLYVLGRLQREQKNEPISFVEAERPLQSFLEEYGPPQTLHADIAGSVGLDLDAATDGEVIDLASRRRRNPAFRNDVLMAYEGRCAMCGWDGRLGGDAVGVEAAHIRWFTIEGPDSLDNGLCLCSMHHKLLDTGAIGISPDRTVAVSLAFVGRGGVAKELVYDLIGRPIEPPQAGLAGPADAHIAWHSAQVFRLPARESA